MLKQSLRIYHDAEDSYLEQLLEAARQQVGIHTNRTYQEWIESGENVELCRQAVILWAKQAYEEAESPAAERITPAYWRIINSLKQQP